jgi:hypothetical protein
MYKAFLKKTKKTQKKHLIYKVSKLLIFLIYERFYEFIWARIVC